MPNRWDLLFIAVAVVGFVYTATTAANEDSQRFKGPIIIPNKSQVILQKGQNYTLTCKGKTPVVFNQQEPPEEVTTINVMQTKAEIDEGEYKFQTVLELYNVDKYTVGYYACHDEQINVSKILNDLSEEPSNTEQISYIYIYVNDTESLFAPMRELVKLKNNSKVVIECRPTTPEVQVTLKETMASDKLTLIAEYKADTKAWHYKSSYFWSYNILLNIQAIPELYSPKIGFVLNNDDLSTYTFIVCVFKGPHNVTELSAMYFKQHIIPPPRPKIIKQSNYFLKGEPFSINCTILYKSVHLFNLVWQYPKNVRNDTVTIESNELSRIDDGGILYKSITVKNPTRDHAGKYVCMSTNQFYNSTDSTTKRYKEKPFIDLSIDLNQPIEAIQNMQRINIIMDSYPPADFHILKDNKSLPINPKKYNVYMDTDIIFEIFNTEVTDTANYTVVATTRNLTKRFTIDYRRKAPPEIKFGSKDDKKYLENQEVTLQCIVTGYPLPNIVWEFSSGERQQTLASDKIIVDSIYKETAYLVFKNIHASGNITCRASNTMGIASEVRQIIVYEMRDGFGIKNKEKDWFSQNQNVNIACIASIYDFSNITWIGQSGEDLNQSVEYTRNPLSLVATLKIPNIALSQSGAYTCRAAKFDGTEENETIDISVAAVQPPTIIEPSSDVTQEIYRCNGRGCLQPMQLTCLAEGVPAPVVEWSKDDVVLKPNSDVEIITTTLNHTIVNSTIMVTNMNDNYTGTYVCEAISNGSMVKRTFSLVLEGTSYTLYLSVIIGIIFVLIILVIYLTIKIRKEKQFRRELAAAGLLYFKEGVTKSLNPDLGIDEQAELLPYDEKFEFPAEKLTLGKQLGAGAFGVVYKAEARGIINAEETTEVAVKMVKKTADNMYIKALASELKIMVHLGKHVNIVNLLGACTKNVGKRELSVIVEYCKFGNIHNYMQRHREVFIDQLTDNKEKNLGRVNRGFSCSSGSTGMHSDYFGACNTQETDHTFINSANTNRSNRKVSEGYVQPEWRSNYESDYSFDGRNPRPLTSRDLLAWAFQIARGMEYLASRKVLHGDLAARNVLLAEDNIVKICDFGLARSIYKNDEYQKKENSLLPVKWLAIECMTDRIFSTQSDVWSFGIVLWELFSLAKTPYPNMEPAHLLSWLSEGKRLAKPTYSDDRIYDVMLKCWEQKPTARPTFSQLQEIIGGFLEDNVRNHYVDLNSAYMDMNAVPSGHEDYLIMMNAPDYNNLVTPSPHHYVNDVNFFPVTPTQLDEDGYLKMNPRQIFSPRPEDNKFDFDARKFNPKVSEASSCGSELTPMLTLNNLPARSGSESDHEGSASPNIGMCPTIDEETDEVFEMKQNNVRNARMNTAVSNPTYITLDVDIEKKPNNFINSYINVPNGLVK